MKKEDIRFHSEIKKFVQVGTPIAFQEILTELSFLALCAFINRLGLDASSSYGVANKIVSFVMLVPGSLMQSMASFAFIRGDLLAAIFSNDAAVIAWAAQYLKALRRRRL